MELSGNNITFKGLIEAELIRDGKAILRRQYHNGVTTEGKNHNLDVVFGATAKITTWYAGLISSVGYTALAAGDTMASHAGWTEFTAYDEATRQAWVNSAASAGSKTSSSQSVFTISGAGTIKGIFITSGSAKGGTAGILWATALDPAGDVVVADNDVYRITYTVSAT